MSVRLIGSLIADGSGPAEGEDVDGVVAAG